MSDSPLFPSSDEVLIDSDNNEMWEHAWTRHPGAAYLAALADPDPDQVTANVENLNHHAGTNKMNLRQLGGTGLGLLGGLGLGHLLNKSWGIKGEDQKRAYIGLGLLGTLVGNSMGRSLGGRRINKDIEENLAKYEAARQAGIMSRITNPAPNADEDHSAQEASALLAYYRTLMGVDDGSFIPLLNEMSENGIPISNIRQVDVNELDPDTLDRKQIKKANMNNNNETINWHTKLSGKSIKERFKENQKKVKPIKDKYKDEPFDPTTPEGKAKLREVYEALHKNEITKEAKYTPTQVLYMIKVAEEKNRQ